jgi:hypothetical protein
MFAFVACQAGPALANRATTIMLAVAVTND